ncbi:hypothetical protein FIBSPDRAFT_404545 [Athelia psychrophila]|uniref:F-box domain-containing protein n=1 Tax=Athelia psychrophila TaxID=1759441 RepID=A0A167UXV1_9AGAM|nr:hypothetical protein FIBSPDRAFT_404545 [Fibularhizoctonia sp. CBS 109695]
MIDSIVLASQHDSALASLANAVLVIAQAHTNATKNIACLPSEILSHIFIVHRDLHRDSAWPDDTLPSIPISHVSKTWRGTALSIASVVDSCFLPFHMMPFYEAMLRRSKESLLTKAAMGPDLTRPTCLPF